MQMLLSITLPNCRIGQGMSLKFFKILMCFSCFSFVPRKEPTCDIFVHKSTFQWQVGAVRHPGLPSPKQPLMARPIHFQIAYLTSEILFLNLPLNFKILRSQTSLNKVLVIWHRELANIYGIFCSWPPLSLEFPQFSPPTQPAAQISNTFTLYICAACCTVSDSARHG